MDELKVPQAMRTYGPILRALERRRRELADLVAERREALDSHGLGADPVKDAADSAFHRSSAEIDSGLIDRYLREIAQVDAAVARAEAGTFGICIDCGQPIEESRLEANPTASRHLECQQRHEKAQALSAPGAAQRRGAA